MRSTRIAAVFCGALVLVLAACAAPPAPGVSPSAEPAGEAAAPSAAETLGYECTPFDQDSPTSQKPPVSIEDLKANLPGRFQNDLGQYLNDNRAIGYVYGVAEASGALVTAPVNADCSFDGDQSQFGRILGAVAAYRADAGGGGNGYGVVSVDDSGSDPARLYIFSDAPGQFGGQPQQEYEQFDVRPIPLKLTGDFGNVIPIDSSIRLYNKSDVVACFRSGDRRYCFAVAKLPGDQLIIAGENTIKYLNDAQILAQFKFRTETPAFALDRSVSEIENAGMLEECPILGQCTTDLIFAPIEPESLDTSSADDLVIGVLAVQRPLVNLPTGSDVPTGAYLLVAKNDGGRPVPPVRVHGVQIVDFDPASGSGDVIGELDVEIPATQAPYTQGDAFGFDATEVASLCGYDICILWETAGR